MSSPPTLRLFLVRHGQVASNRDFRFVGRSDEPLTDLGREQARALGELLAQVGLQRLVCSPLTRTRQTAESIESRSGVAVVTDERLREQDFGRWEGLTRDEVRALGDADRTRLREMDADPTVAPPGGEALADVQRRIVGLVEELAAADVAGSVALVSHVGPIKTFLSAALELDLAQQRRFFLDPGTITVIDWGERPMLRMFNSHGHLRWGDAPWMS